MGRLLKRIHVTHTLIVGAVAALVFGAAAATLATSTKERVNDEPITVPVGRIGDRAVYAFHRGDPTAENDWNAHGPLAVGVQILARHPDAKPPPASGLQPAGARAFEIDSVVSAYDAAHVRHDAVVVARNETHPDYPGFLYTLVEHVDLDVRQVFREDQNAAFGAKPAQKDANAPSSGLGSVQTSDFNVRDPTLPGVAYQGRTLRLGDVLRDRDVAPPPGLDGQVVQVHEREWVEARQRINGADAYGVRLEVTYRAIPSAVTPTAGGPEPPAGGGSAAAEVHVRAWRVDWMGPEQAYAVLREAGLEFTQGGQTVDVSSHRVAYVLQRVDAGHAFIPWAAHEGPHWAAQRGADLERTPGAKLHPDDGSPSSLRYGLADAIQRVENDLLLPNYRLWRQANPGAMLVGATYGERADPSTGFRVAEWRLLNAVASGSAYEVVSQKNLQTDAVSNTGQGERNTGAFNPAEVPVNPPTLAALERTWADYVSAPARSKGFNYVRWGFDLSGARASCPSSADFQFGVTAKALFRSMEGGHSQAGECPGTQPSGGSAVVLDVASGRVLSGFESQFQYGFGAKGLPFTSEMRAGWNRAASTVPGTVRAPTPAETAASGAGVLAVFLAVYFWPTLKFLGAAVVAPLYAKIAKEDLLNNPVREQVLSLIRTNPGIHASDIARQTGAGWGTIVYHLGVLERNKVVTSLVDGRHKRFFPADTVDYSKRGQLAALMNQNTRAIYDLIDQQPGIVQGDLAGRTGLTIPTVIWHLQRLEEAGLVGRDKEGRRFHYFANPVYQPKPSPPPPDAMEVQ